MSPTSITVWCIEQEVFWLGLASSLGYSQILSRSCGEKSDFLLICKRKSGSGLGTRLLWACFNAAGFRLSNWLQLRCYSQAPHPHERCTFIRLSNLLAGGLVCFKANSPNTPGISDYIDYFKSTCQIYRRWIKFLYTSIVMKTLVQCVHTVFLQECGIIFRAVAQKQTTIFEG